MSEARRSRLHENVGATVGTAIDIVAFCVLLGGLLTIGAVVAPTAFHAAQTAPSLSGDTAAQKALAGQIVGGSLRVFNYAAIVCGAALLTAPLRLRRPHSPRLLTVLFAAVAACSLAVTLALQFWMFPQLDGAQVAGAMRRFDMLHRAYVAVSQGQMILLVTAIALYSAIIVRSGDV